MAHHIDQTILRHLAQNHWVATKSELVSLGLTARSIERRVAADLLTSFGHGVVGIADQHDSPMISLAKLTWLIEWVIKEGLTDRARIQACARALNRQGRPGTVERRTALTTLLDDEPFDLTVLENLFLHLAGRLGIEGLEVQFVPPWYDGVSGIVDFAIPHLRIIIEVDGRRWHSLTQDQRRDRTRDRTARSEGWMILRYGWDELQHRVDEVAADLMAAIALATRLAA